MAARALVFDIWQDIVRYSVTYILLLFVVMSAFFGDLLQSLKPTNNQ